MDVQSPKKKNNEQTANREAGAGSAEAAAPATSPQPSRGRERSLGAGAREAAVNLGQNVREVAGRAAGIPRKAWEGCWRLVRLLLQMAMGLAEIINVFASIGIPLALSISSLVLGWGVTTSLPDVDTWQLGGFLACASGWLAFQRWADANDDDGGEEE